jgi:hypothetical protein
MQVGLNKRKKNPQQNRYKNYEYANQKYKYIFIHIYKILSTRVGFITHFDTVMHMTVSFLELIRHFWYSNY